VSIDEDQRITLFNDGAAKMFGWSTAETVGRPLDMLLPERFRAIHRQHVERFASGPRAARKMGERDRPIFGLRKDGQEFPADAAISKIQVYGHQVLTVVLRDMTEVKRVEDDLRFLSEVGAVVASTLDLRETLDRIARLVTGVLADW